jgi:hypothetical protein
LKAEVDPEFVGKETAAVVDGAWSFLSFLVSVAFSACSFASLDLGVIAEFAILSLAHAALELLRECGDEWCLFLHSILELHKQPVLPQDHMEELLFHCILGCRQVLLRQWQQCFFIVF